MELNGNLVFNIFTKRWERGRWSSGGDVNIVAVCDMRAVEKIGTFIAAAWTKGDGRIGNYSSASQTGPNELRTERVFEKQSSSTGFIIESEEEERCSAVQRRSVRCVPLKEYIKSI